MPSQKLTIPNADGDQLVARLDTPVDGEPAAYALFAHCFTCTKNLRAAGNISHALAQAGIAVLRFDFTGLGESEGDFANTNFSSNVSDLVVVADALRDRYAAPQLLIGHSLGGAAVLHAAHSIPEASAVVTIAAPSEPTHITKRLGINRDALRPQGSVTVHLGGQAFQIKEQFLDDLEAVHMADTIRNLRRALLVLHSPMDDVINVNNAGAIFQAARHPKSFVSLDQADHLLSLPSDSQYAGAVIAAWASKYIGHTKAGLRE